jgi:hypothetical protein
MSIGSQRIRNFSAVIEDPPSLPAGIPLWGQNTSTNTILGWDENGAKVREAPWPDASPPKFFIESKDGFLYSVHSPNTIKRWKVTSSNVISALTVLTTSAAPAGYGFAAGFEQRNMMIGPDGRVYCRVIEENIGLRHKWFRLVSGTPWTLAEEVLNTIAVDDWLHFIINLTQTGWYGTRLHSSAYVGDPEAEEGSRFFWESILKSGRWVAADGIPLNTGTVAGGGGIAGYKEVMGPESQDLCLIGNFDFPCTGGDYTSVTVRVWGDAWWERISGVWQNVVNGGLTVSAAKDMAPNLFFALTQSPNPPSTFASTRITHGAGNRLPMLRFKQNLYGVSPYDNDVPYQGLVLMRADATHVYIFLRGADDTDGVYRQGGIYQAPIPATGQAPGPWTKILTEPDFNASPQVQWQDFDLTDKFLWLTEVQFGGGGGARLVRYNKSGTDRVVKQTYTGYNFALNLQTGWNHRWK